MRLLKHVFARRELLDSGTEQALARVVKEICRKLELLPDLLLVYFKGREPSVVDPSGERPASPAFSESTATSTNSSAPTHDANGRRRRQARTEDDFLLIAVALNYVASDGPTGSHSRASLAALIRLVCDHDNSSQRLEHARVALLDCLIDADFPQVLAASIVAAYAVLPSRLVTRYHSMNTGELKTDFGLDNKDETRVVLGGMDDGDSSHETSNLDDLEVLRTGIIGASGLSSAIDRWLSLLELLDDSMDQLGDVASSDDDSSEVAHAQVALSELTGEAFRTLFLRGVLYPSILESSSADGSAVAVLHYISVVLDTIHRGSALEKLFLSFMLAEDDDKDDIPRHGHGRTEKARARAKPVERDTYFSDIGRFTLKDLLVTSFASGKTHVIAAALRVLRSILARHPTWTLAMFDVRILARTAPLLDALDTSLPSREEEDVSSESDAEEARSPTTPRIGKSISTSTQLAPSTPLQPRLTEDSTPLTPGLLVGALLPDTPEATGSSAAGAVSSVLTTLRQVSPADGTELDPSGTSMASYIQDAKLALAAELLEVLEVEAGELPRSSRFARRLGVREVASLLCMPYHAISPRSPLIRHMLRCLSSWFANSPDTNLALSATITVMATSPQRSLEGWFISVPQEEAGTISVTDVLRSLAGALAEFRGSVLRFEDFLEQRRAGLMFVDSLTEALESDGGGNFSGLSSALEQLETPQVAPSPAQPKGKSQSLFTSLFSPARRPQAQPRFEAPATPTRSTPSDVPMSVSSTESPYIGHYKQTAAIAVRTRTVVPHLQESAESNDSEDDEGSDALVASPSRRVRTQVVSPPKSEASEAASSAFSGGPLPSPPVPRSVKLSTVLDNVVLLEEWCKELLAVVKVRRAFGLDD